MKNIIFFWAILLAFAGCELSDKKTHPKKATVEVDNTSTIEQKHPIAQTHKRKITSDDDFLNNVTKDKFIDGIQYKDLLGDNFLVIYKAGRLDAKDTLDYGNLLVAEKYVKMNNELKLVWSIKDFNSIYGCNIEYLPNSLDINDADADGIFESSFLYYFPCDGADPVLAKFMLHINNKKHVLKLKIPVILNEFKTREVFMPESLNGYNQQFLSFYKTKSDSLALILYQMYQNE